MALVVALGLMACRRAGVVQTGPLTTADAVLRLSWDQAAFRPEAHLSGIVTVFDSFAQTVFIQDRTGAVWATLPPGTPSFPGGSSINISGLVTAIGRDRAIIYPTIGSVGPGIRPEPRQLVRADLTAEAKNYELSLVRVRIKQLLAASGREIRFSAEMPGGLVEVRLLHAPPIEIERYVGQEVDLVGVAAPLAQVSVSASPLFLADALTPLVELKAATTGLKLLTTVRQVKSLSALEARRSYPVALRGVVTTSSPGLYMLTLQDETGAIYLALNTPDRFPPGGFRIRVEGKTSPGETAPSVVVSKLTVENRAQMPAPAELSSFKLDDVRLDNLWVHLDAVIRWVAPDPAGGFRLTVATPRFRTTVSVRSGTAAEAARLVPGTAVSLEGTYSPESDRFRHWRDFRIYTPTLSGIRIRQPGSGTDVAAQVRNVPLQSLFTYGSVSDPTVPIRIRGVVILSGADRSIYITDGGGSVQVAPVPSFRAVKRGTLVEATGFLPTDPSKLRLEDATWQVMGTGTLPEAPFIQAESALDGSYESRWVRLEGRLIHRQQAIEYNILVLQTASALVNVYSTGVANEAWQSLREGSLLEVSGVVRPFLDRTGLVGSRTVRMLIGSSQDIQVIHAASWWTPRHLTATLIAGSALFFALFAVALVLWQRVRRQSQIIEQRLAVEARLKLEAQAASRAKTEFLSSMSHEIRTPMHGILGLTELALQSAGQPTQVTYLQNALQSARSLMGILNDVLDLARIESGALSLAQEKFSFSPLLEPVITRAHEQCEAKGVQLVCNVAPDVPDILLGDALRLRQIVINLISNACKFTHEGRIEVSASAENVAGDCFSLVLRVRDTGIGIAPEHISRIFGAFEQVDRSDSRRYGGTGLGLAICLKLAHLMGGNIEVSSKSGEGSDFCVHLPMRRAPDIAAPGMAPSSPPGIKSASTHASVQPLKILAAEDNRVNRLLLAKILEKAGHRATFAENGAETIRLWEHESFDLLLMDLQMPVMDGLEAAKEIRKREAGHQAHIPIVAVTARAMQGDRELAVAAGMDGYVAKPYSSEDILNAIRSALRQRHDTTPN